MSGAVHFRPDGDDGIARVVLDNAGKLNAIDIAMWRELRRVFDALQAQPPHDAPRAVIGAGAAGNFASGGDIVEFATFRFDEAKLHDFHEHTVAPGLHAMLACDIPLFAQIDGACIGGGARTLQRAHHAAARSPQAARINKRTLRQLAAGGPTTSERRAHFDYAASAEHREGVTAFIEQRSPRFRP